MKKKSIKKNISRQLASKPDCKSPIKYIPMSENEDLEKRITNSLFKIIDNRVSELKTVVIEPGATIKSKDGEPYTSSQQRAITLQTPIKVTPVAKYELIPYRKKRATVKDGLTLARQWATEIDRYRRLEDSYDLHYQIKVFGLDKKSGLKPTKEYKKFERELYLKKGLNKSKKEMIWNLFEILVDNISNPISHRMASYYVAKVLIASNIETDLLEKVEANLQVQYRKH